MLRHFIVWLVNSLFLFTADHGTRKGHSDSRRYVKSSVITSFYIHFTLHWQRNMTVCGVSLHHGNTESRENLHKNSSFNWVHSILTGSMHASHSTNLFTNSYHHISTNGKGENKSTLKGFVKTCKL